MLERLADAYMGPRDGGWTVVRWRGRDILVTASGVTLSSGWILKQDGSLTWTATRPEPCPGPRRWVAHVNGKDPRFWSLDRWECARTCPGTGFLVCCAALTEWGDLLRPTPSGERSRIMRRGRGSRPGLSCWKPAFLPLYPAWAQEAYWLLVDTQRACCMVATALKTGLQVHLLKPSGGYRPLTMLEDSFKAIEGPVTRRKLDVRSRLSVGDVYSGANLAGESGRRAASEVLYLDVLVCEDSCVHNLPLARVPADYEKFYNTIQMVVVDAVEQCRGVPDDARRFLMEVFGDVKVLVETRWGVTDTVSVTRGVPQGSISGGEASKPSQDPILRLRDSSAAHYLTSAGRRVVCVVYVDDSEHYGSGARDLVLIIQELGHGSVATGIGFSWIKFSAYASDWDAARGAAEAGLAALEADGVRATGWNIWEGGTTTQLVPRSYLETEEKLLGKRGCIADRHSLARHDMCTALPPAQRIGAETRLLG